MKGAGLSGFRELVDRLDSRTGRSRTRVNETLLDTRKIYILPTRHGLLLALMLIVLLLAAINYQNALVYLLTFLLAGLAIVSFLHTQRNLLALRVTATGCEPVFAGESALFHVCVRNPSAARAGVQIDAGPVSTAPFDIPANDTRCVALRVPAARRGWFDCPPFELATHYPLGISRAWSRRLRLTARCLVYPKPADESALTILAGSNGEGLPVSGPDGEQFTGVRDYRAGDPLARISWKTLARGQGLHTKEFGSAASPAVWIDWASIPAADPEARLSCMTRAVLDADAAGMRYGLRLPSRTVAPANGDVHRAHCLEALALHDVRD